MDLNVYNISYIVGLFGEPNQVHYLPNMERGIDTSGILTMEYNSFKAVSMAAKDCGAPARYVIQGTKGYILQKSTANWCGGVTFHPNQGKEEHFNLNGGRPRRRRSSTPLPGPSRAVTRSCAAGCWIPPWPSAVC